MEIYKPTPKVEQVLVKGKILAPGETPQEMFNRVVQTLFSIEPAFGTPIDETTKARDRFAHFVAAKAFSPGTPTLTNAGRLDHQESTLSSCTVIPVNLREKNEAISIIRSYYHQNMGSGFDFTPYENPVELLEWLNQLSIEETATGQYDRYIGNMGTLAVFHPQIRDFVRIKKEKDLKHFNISVSVTEQFMDAANKEKDYQLTDGTVINARNLLEEISECAWFNGDPGIVYMDRMNRDNPVAYLSPYVSTPPCAEMGLASGETCQFGYLNLSYFAKPKGIDWSELQEATSLMTRALDNAIEISLKNFPTGKSQDIAKLKRKIGIGICGLADTFIKYDLPYDAEEARQLARDLLSFINFNSKVASVQLAEERGSCLAMYNITHNRYLTDRFLEKKFTQNTNTVSIEDWKKLDYYIRNTRLLRNILTTALPPTGRASILMGVTSGIEPIFAPNSWNEGTKQTVKDFVERHGYGYDDWYLMWFHKNDSVRTSDLEKKEVLKTAKEIHPFDHMRMVADLVGKNGIYDEAASKTINLRQSITVEDVLNIFLYAHELGLKNISVYRDNSHENQPANI